MYNLAIISGDGIGQEVMSACEYLLDKLDLESVLNMVRQALNVSTITGQHCLKRQSE